VLGVPPHHPHRHLPQFLFDHAVKWNPPRNDPHQSLMVSSLSIALSPCHAPIMDVMVYSSSLLPSFRHC
jgi:hypothetical protein